ncbi:MULTISPECIES: type II secretion system protein [unclassified Vibrio]|uniref:PilW family protein n=1 Tax=unclassified Vibrio TaxID=2614977 RepID=UPI001483AFF1|nr:MULTISPECIES: type II secretion system protein [unclassified Vibrio]NNN44614.1 type II secretion system protein [Vibrio sp. 1-1(7)]NNN73130.1 type II secretion system protein [Vibrio sp. 12-2(3-a)]
MQRGFTLIEMVMAIILLGIVGLFLGNIAGQAMGIYATSTSREALIQQGQFMTERLSREIRQAVPNSVIVENDCIEFLPIINSGVYSQLPHQASGIKMLPLLRSTQDNLMLEAGDRIVVYPTNPMMLRQSLDPVGPHQQVAELTDKVTFSEANAHHEVELDFTRLTSFELQSPARRVYVYREPVAYCYLKAEKKIYRYQGYPLTLNQLPPQQPNAKVLMAEKISKANFVEAEPVLQRNGLIKMELTFEDRGEQVRFDHNALIYNAP